MTVSYITKLRPSIDSELLLLPAFAAVIRDPEEAIVLQEEA